MPYWHCSISYRFLSNRCTPIFLLPKILIILKHEGNLATIYKNLVLGRIMG